VILARAERDLRTLMHMITSPPSDPIDPDFP
jgi:hypothetical protein